MGARTAEGELREVHRSERAMPVVGHSTHAVHTGRSHDCPDERSVRAHALAQPHVPGDSHRLGATCRRFSSAVPRDLARPVGWQHPGCRRHESDGKTWLDQAGNLTSEAIRVIERFTMVDPNTIHYEARIEDPSVYTRPWTMVFAIRRNMDPRYEVYEEACHEGEKDTEHLLGAGYTLYPGITRR